MMMTAGTDGSPGTLKQVDAGVLSVGYAEAGPGDGAAVVLLHGWPYDIHSYADVTPLLASAGYRVIVPYLRGYGTTRFLAVATFRNGQQSVLGVDVIALMDALGIADAGHRRIRLGRTDRQCRGRPVAQPVRRGDGVGLAAT